MDAHSLLSPLRAPTELADERSAISVDLSDATSALSKNQLESSLQPLRESEYAHHPVSEVIVTDEAVWINSVLDELKILEFPEISQRKLLNLSEIYFRKIRQKLDKS